MVDNTSGSSNTTNPDGVDWWDAVNAEQNTADSMSFPLDVWSPLLPHDTGRALISVPELMIPVLT